MSHQHNHQHNYPAADNAELERVRQRCLKLEHDYSAMASSKDAEIREAVDAMVDAMEKLKDSRAKTAKLIQFTADVFSELNEKVYTASKEDLEYCVLIRLDKDQRQCLKNACKNKSKCEFWHVQRRKRVAKAAKKKRENCKCCMCSEESATSLMPATSKVPMSSSSSSSVASSSTKASVIEIELSGDESASVDPRTTLQQVGGGLVARKRSTALRQKAVASPRVGRRPVIRGKGHGQFDAANGPISKASKPKSATLGTSSVRSSAPRKSPIARASASGHDTKCPSRGGLGLASKTCSKMRSVAVASDDLYETPNPRKVQRRNSLQFSSSTEFDSDAEFSAEPEHACSSSKCLTYAKPRKPKPASTKATKPVTFLLSDHLISLDCCGQIPRETDVLETETTSSENEPIMPQWTATRTQLAADTSEQFEDASVPSIPAVVSPPFAFRRKASGRSAVPPQTEPHSKSWTLATKLKPLVKISSSRLFTRKSDGSHRAVAQPLASHPIVAETRKESTARMHVGSAQVAKSRASQKVGGLLKADDVKSDERIDAAKSEGLSEPQPVGGLLTDAQTVAFLQSVSDGSDDDVSDGSAKDTDSSSEEIRTTNFSAYPIPDISCFGSAAVTGNMVKAEASSSDEADVKPTDKYLPKLERED